ncbi:MAG: hypothetical protein KDI71_03685 [Xanthomonadales bacterium]|nr:hypothetical protein [Xanthomonadales bacterium]
MIRLIKLAGVAVLGRNQPWWAARDPQRGGLPNTVADALAHTHRLIAPTAIAVREAGKYPEIVSYELPAPNACAA